jgi:hypothetical protein
LRSDGEEREWQESEIEKLAETAKAKTIDLPERGFR